MKMYLDLTYKSISDQLSEALSKKTLIVTTARTRRIGKTQALVDLAAFEEVPVVVRDSMVNMYTKEYPNVRIIGESAAKRSSTLLDTVLVEEGVQEKTITILRDKGVTVSGFFVDPRWSVVAGEKYVPYEIFGTPVLMTKEEAENLEPRTFEDPPLLQITLKDMNSIPEVIHNGEPLEGRIDIDFNWKTGGFDTVGSTYINLRTLGIKGKKPSEKRIEYKQGEALHEEVTKTLQ
ncbi:hypothetical protein [Bacillus pumilus]|uniref:hypothetical protein n=1 Tax=Bacillus pumilus TaxID=1408 RepID=UPI0022822B60|nr:hypothetical protein [Bacillus pumilus]MCY7572374.1 hypothetical protein [Bacillus pumilus]MCY7577579.1 hypothetical protein [Bacillus pumilus]MEC3761072.1 hypothetical protein [Bacillus pumilus]